MDIYSERGASLRELRMLVKQSVIVKPVMMNYFVSLRELWDTLNSLFHKHCERL